MVGRGVAYRSIPAVCGPCIWFHSTPRNTGNAPHGKTASREADKLRNLHDTIHVRIPIIIGAIILVKISPLDLRFASSSPLEDEMCHGDFRLPSSGRVGGIAPHPASQQVLSKEQVPAPSPRKKDDRNS